MEKVRYGLIIWRLKLWEWMFRSLIVLKIKLKIWNLTI